jgi:hypothetical protein
MDYVAIDPKLNRRLMLLYTLKTSILKKKNSRSKSKFVILHKTRIFAPSISCQIGNAIQLNF